LNAAAESQPLVLEHRAVSVSYTDGLRRRSPAAEVGRPRGASWGSRRNESYHDYPRQEQPWQPRPDWICDEVGLTPWRLLVEQEALTACFGLRQCDVTNFARRSSCFQCNAPRTARTREVPTTASFQMRSHNDSLLGYAGPSSAPEPSPSGGSFARDGEVGLRRRGPDDDNPRRIPPSQVLMVRLLPPDIEEGEVRLQEHELDRDDPHTLCSSRWPSPSLTACKTSASFETATRTYLGASASLSSATSKYEPQHSWPAEGTLMRLLCCPHCGRRQRMP